LDAKFKSRYSWIRRGCCARSTTGNPPAASMFAPLRRLPHPTEGAVIHSVARPERQRTKGY
jgi:hypothetical protein